MNQTAEGMIYLSNLQEGLEIDPHNEFEAMLEAPAHLSELYMAIQELERLVQGVADWSSRKHLHPSTDLSRISELLLSTIGMFESISNQMSWAESSTTTFEQLKRNLTALSTSMLRLTYWLRQMSYAAL